MKIIHDEKDERIKELEASVKSYDAEHELALESLRGTLVELAYARDRIKELEAERDALKQNELDNWRVATARGRRIDALETRLAAAEAVVGAARELALKAALSATLRQSGEMERWRAALASYDSQNLNSAHHDCHVYFTRDGGTGMVHSERCVKGK